MQKKFAIIYHRLHKIIGQGNISKFLEKLVRSQSVRPYLESEYAVMSRDEKRENEAMEWAEITFKETNRL
jgi:hypothetical protein